MEMRKLGRSDLDVSLICLGTMTWGEQNTEQEAFEQLDYAVGEGINFIDAAEMYPVPPKSETQGLTEQYLGNWLARRGRRPRRPPSAALLCKRCGKMHSSRTKLQHTRE